MTQPFTLDPRDREVFRQTVGPVKPLRSERVTFILPPPAPIPRFTLADEQQVLSDMLSDYFEPADLDTGEELYYRREGVQQAVLRKLRRGYFQIGPVLDLHGMTVAIAREALAAFLHSARRDGLSFGCVGDYAEAVAQPLDGGAGHENRSFKRIAGRAGFGAGQSQQQTLWWGYRSRTHVAQQKTAGTVGILGLSGVETALAEECSLLVAGDARDRNGCSEKV